MHTARGDIAARPDIERMVDSFYAKVRADDLLGPIFDDVAKTDWAHHLPKMYDFWETVLFGVSRFHGDPLSVHLALNDKVPIGAREFGRWVALFHETVDSLFAGPIAEGAKMRAARIAVVMQEHIRPGSPAAERARARACQPS
jgi:hemoglobin